MPRNRSEKETVIMEGHLNFSGTTTVLSGSPPGQAVFNADPFAGGLTYTVPPRENVQFTPPVTPGQLQPTVRALVQLPVLEHESTFDVYEVDTGVEYWYFCESISHAIACHFATYRDEGVMDEDIETFSISKISRARADTLRFTGDDGEDECSMYQAGERYGPGFIACSEY